MNKNEIIKDNKQLKDQLMVANNELETVKNSKGYKVVRLVGHAKNELKKSPVSFTKKSVKKILSKGGLKKSVHRINSNINSKDDLQTQYKQWIILNEPDETKLSDQSQKVRDFKQKPLISIITPVFNPPADVFIDLIESVLSQTYPNFELCLGNFGDDIQIKEIIKKYSMQDPRIKNFKFSTNKGIAANSNLILKEVRGEFIALLDHDDTISPDALYENVKIINSQDVDFIFSDKDKIDEVGNRFEPFFKPGWSPDIMLNANYLTHLNVMRTSMVKKIGGWSEDTDGAQDWDLFLKIVSASNKIAHIPKVLYHWRVIATSTALSIETKPYALKGQRVTVDRYLKKLKVNATSYHVGAELLIKWKPITEKIHIILFSSNTTNTNRFISNFKHDKNFSISILCKGHHLNIEHQAGIEVTQYQDGELVDVIAKQLDTQKSKYTIVASDIINTNDIDDEKITSLLGWLGIPGISSVSPRVVASKSEHIVESGALIMAHEAKPLFVDKLPYYHSILGNVEWIKDVTLGSSLFSVCTTNDLKNILKNMNKLSNNDNLFSYTMHLAMYLSGKRNIINPKVILNLHNNHSFDVESHCDLFNSEVLNSISVADPYSNPNASESDPMRIVEITQDNTAPENKLVNATEYNLEAAAHALNNQIDATDIKANQEFIKSQSFIEISKNNPSFLFILPGFNAIYAGLNNIFSFASYVSSKGSKVGFAITVGENNLNVHKNMIEEKYPDLRNNIEYYSASVENIDRLPNYDIAVCTQWATAYFLLKYDKCYRKCYFIQDKEASFYPKGTISALVDNTYKFGFFALANTPGLLKWYKEEFGGNGLTIKSKIDLSIFSPPKELNIKPTKPYKVFFYGRPAEPRNAFELGIVAVSLLKDKYKDDIEIYTAGAYWDPLDYNLDGIVKNLGKISYDKLPAFYRSMDVGLMFMFSGHPGVVASELMASGCPVVVNQYDDDTWNSLYRDKYNAIASLPTTKSVFEAIDYLLTDEKLRKKIINNGLTTVKDFYAGYEESCDVAIKELKKGTL